jgi:ferrous iron transport protein B
VENIGVRMHASETIVVVGNPNSGKSTLFNRLTGMRQRTANYPGVTVEKHVGTVKLENNVLELVDLPGMFALSAQSLEEQIAVDVLLGRMANVRRPNGILAVLDTTNLYQGLYLLQQLLSLDLPVVVAMTMTDAAHASGLHVDVEALKERLGGIEICPPLVFRRERGVAASKVS